MASQVLSGASNASYTNNTGQNVRLIINYMSNVTSMTWAGVTVTASSTTIGKDIQNITGELRSVTIGKEKSSGNLGRTRYTIYEPDISKKAEILHMNDFLLSIIPTTIENISNRTTRVTSDPQDFIIQDNMARQHGFYIDPLGSSSTQVGGLGIPAKTLVYNDTYVYVPTTISRGGNFPVELMLASGQSFSSVCGAYNAIVIKEDGT